MRRLWTIIGVGDVAASVAWYQALFGLPAIPPAHDDFGQILDADGTVLLCLHAWGPHGHPTLTSADIATPGNGLLLFFRVDDYEPALARARRLVPVFEEEPHVNPNTGTWEFSVRDPDGSFSVQRRGLVVHGADDARATVDVAPTFTPFPSAMNGMRFDESPSSHVMKIAVDAQSELCMIEFTIEPTKF